MAATHQGPALLIVEDERPLAEILRENLEREGYGVATAESGAEAVAALARSGASLVILDIMLPKLDGFAVCEAIRARSNVPVLMLTAKDTEEDKLRGFEVGADDYLTKPFSARELHARVRALLRRAGAGDAPEVLRADDLVVDTRARSVQRAGHALDLSVREFDLLVFLMRRPGQLFSREQLLSEVWGYDYLGDSARTVDVTIWRLRSKIEPDGGEPRYILSRRGMGYLFRAPG
jgi:two-component system response regulator VicR